MILFQQNIPAGWEGLSAEQLSAMLIKMGKMKVFRLTGAFQLATAKGANEAEQAAIFAELAKVYGLPNNEFIRNLRDAIRGGDKEQVLILAQIGAEMLAWSDLTVGALTAVIEDLTIAPTAEDVTAGLAAMGFEFVDGRWVAATPA